jgi:hypothetical protein
MTEFGEFSLEVSRKPVAGVTDVAIPEKLAELLKEHAPKALADADFELTLTAANPDDAKKLALYARAWGARQEPKLYINKIPNRRDMSANVARLSVKKDEDVKPENRPGRRNGDK